VLETYYVGVYWGARQETAAACAHRASRFFQSLAACAPSFQQWYLPARGRSTPGTPGLPLRANDLQALEAVMLEGRHFTDSGHHVIEELGFTLTAWNSRKHASDMTLSCGSSSPHVGNACVMSFPSQGEVFERLVSTPLLTQVLSCMVSAWEPEWGVATSRILRELVSPPHSKALFPGWLTYFSRRRGTVPPLPVPARIAPMGNEGTLITLSDERLTASNPEHRNLLTRLHHLLDRTGLLLPLGP